MAEISSLQSEVHLPLQMSGEESFELEVRANQRCLTATPEAQVSATLLPAMQDDADVVVDDPLDPRYADNLSTIQDIYATWYEEADRVTVQAPEGDSRPAGVSNGKTATFFTGGVDSFYTLLKHEEEIDELVYVHGFDVDLHDASLRQQVSNMILEIGEQFDKDVIELETNLREFSDSYANWERYHGAALSMIGHVLGRTFSTIFIAATHTYSDLFPWGSHPLLDPLWSTCQFKFIHDGCEANRVRKCEKIATCESALESLRVCWKNPDSAYNCGKCEKCLRTMVNLIAVRGLDYCTTFDSDLNVSRLRNLEINDDNTRAFVRENISALQHSGRHPEIIEALESALAGPTTTERILKIFYGIWKNIKFRINRILSIDENSK